MELIQPVKGKLIYAPDGIISQYFNDPNTKGDLLAFYKSLGLQNHNGIDFVGARGTPIYAAHSGTVTTWLGEGGARSGKMIKLQGNGIYTLYMHNEELLVHTGETVMQEQIISKMGNSGSTPQFYMGVHLHFGLYECNSKGDTLNFNNEFHGAIDALPLLINNQNNTNTMLTIIGDKSSGRQYIKGIDNKLRWIFNEALLSDLHLAGVVDKNSVSWQDNLDGIEISEPWCIIKTR